MRTPPQQSDRSDWTIAFASRTVSGTWRSAALELVASRRRCMAAAAAISSRCDNIQGPPGRPPGVQAVTARETQVRRPRSLAAESEGVRALLVCGVIAGPLVIVVFLIEGAMMPDCDPLRHPVSPLALGPYGWTQTASERHGSRTCAGGHKSGRRRHLRTAITVPVLVAGVVAL
jgi:Protein of unknown function (DUF998)